MTNAVATSVSELFAAQVARTPEAVALEDQSQRLTYSQLDARASAFAQIVKERGVAPDGMVVISAARSLDALVAILAIVKAGGAYVPLDPSHPAARLQQLFADVKPLLVLASGEAKARHAALFKSAISIDGCASLAAEAPGVASVTTANAPHDLIYAMFTSGSSGHPKGVAVPHQAVVRLVIGADFCDLSASQTFLQLSPLAFDASTLEIWGAWLNGGRLVVPQAGSPSLDEIGRLIRAHQITTLWLTAGLFHVMVEERLEDLRPLQQLLCGGDVLSVPHVKRARRELPDVRLINGYGPTENTTFSTCYTIPADVPEHSVPIGVPIHGTSVRILDEELVPVPDGSVGELFVGGLGLARGYVGQPELTREKFLELKDLGRHYRTGDLVRMLPGGILEFAGRRDGQVKVCGYRIELGEIEAQLRSEPEVRDAVVRVRSPGGGDKQLIAYIVPREGSPEKLAAELGARLADRLPDYMLPSAIVSMEHLPLNANGKVDLTALPVPTSGIPEHTPPRAQLEQSVV